MLQVETKRRHALAERSAQTSKRASLHPTALNICSGVRAAGTGHAHCLSTCGRKSGDERTACRRECDCFWRRQNC